MGLNQRGSKLQKQILRYLVKNASTNITEIADALGKLRPSVSRSIRLLRNKGLLNGFNVTPAGVHVIESEYSVVDDVYFSYYQCYVCFDCPCGVREIYLDESQTKFTCECGREYRFSAILEKKMS